MYSTCLTCHRHLGVNEEIPAFPVGVRLAFDPARGRLWVVCPHCDRWNLTALDERWEAIEACERLFRSTPLRVSTDEIGLAQLGSGLQLIRIGRALRPELAAWRYGRRYAGRSLARLLGRAATAAQRVIPRFHRGYDAATWMRLHARPGRILDAVSRGAEERVLLRVSDLPRTALIRPSRGESWRLVVEHEQGPLVLTGEPGLRTAGRLLAALNGSIASADQVRGAVRRLQEAGDPDGYFARVTQLALRTAWGRDPNAARNLPVLPAGLSRTEQLAFYLTSRSFWARGSTDSEGSTPLPHLPLEDRLALEMAAHEDTERRALQGELAELTAAWREAEEIAAIADSLLERRRAGFHAAPPALEPATP